MPQRTDPGLGVCHIQMRNEVVKVNLAGTRNNKALATVRTELVDLCFMTKMCEEKRYDWMTFSRSLPTLRDLLSATFYLLRQYVEFFFLFLFFFFSLRNPLQRDSREGIIFFETTNEKSIEDDKIKRLTSHTLEVFDVLGVFFNGPQIVDNG